MAVLLEPERRVGEGDGGDQRARVADPELTGEDIRAEEGERVGEEEDEVVADDRVVGPVSDEARGRVSDQGVAERERVGLGPELVRLEEVEWLVRECVAAPGDLPRLRERIAEVLRDRLAEVEDEGPVLEAGTRCLVVEDVVTSGGSTVRAIERVTAEGLEVAGTLSVVDRLAGGAEAIEGAGGSPYRPLVTIDELYPDRPDRG